MTDVNDSQRSRFGVKGVLLASLVLIAVAFAYLLGQRSADSSPSEQSADVGFARSMATHHAQAVTMADMVREETLSPEIRMLATDVVLTQQAQIGQMEGWLAAWGRPLTGGSSPMAWMGHGSEMSGMASVEQVGALDKASASDADRKFVDLMIPHHEGGVAMAKVALERAERPEVKRLAQAIVNSQESELRVLRALQSQLAQSS